MSTTRLDDLRKFYAALSNLEERLGGARLLSTCNGRMKWPQRGVYFFREQGESRSESGQGSRIVRVGTHALRHSGNTILWERLSQHRGQVKSGGGNHRGSIFRLLVGTALIEQHGYSFPHWGRGSFAKRDILDTELALEREVSVVVGRMLVLWLGIDDEASPESLRGYIERNTIALLSNYRKDQVDPPSPEWLGRYCNRDRVLESGLWNSNHVDKSYDPKFPDAFERLVSEMSRPS